MCLDLISEESYQEHKGSFIFPVAETMKGLDELALISKSNQQLLEAAQHEAPKLAEVLYNIEKKIDIVLRNTLTGGIDISGLFMRDIDLSEGGLMFDYPEPIEPGVLMEIKLLFPADMIGLNATAISCRSTPTENNSHNIGVEFLKLPENCRTTLSKLIISHQAQQRMQINSDDGYQEL